MRFADVEFPQAILDAQERGDLVIFAGAGVSMPAPSNLPDFRKLANELANGTAELQADEAIDRFLGKLPENLNIHERTRGRLTVTDSNPNSLHHDLLRIFPTASSVRLVTTNFDDHFAAAALKRFSGECPEMFFAPALPVGNDFRGIVHIHGSVRKGKDPRRMVLTDKDFGRAYLTEGWARRFVQEVFLKYTVLFVGYSHDDPVMHYLARGLPPSELGQRRFALAPAKPKSVASWENRGIQLIPYAEADGHIQLRQACTKWADFAISSPLEKREKIERIVATPPQPTGEEIGIIEKALSDITLLRFVTARADTLEWLEWASNRDAFKRLFRNDVTLTECDRELGFWFAQKFSTKHAGSALDLVRRNGSVLPPALWNAVAWTVWTGIKTGESLPSLSKWIPLLIANHSPKGNDFLEYILIDCPLPEHLTSAVLLFGHLLHPLIRVKQNITQKLDPNAGPDISVDLETGGSVTYLAKAWERLQVNDLGKGVYQLVAIASAHLEEATRLYRSYGAEFEGWDPVSIQLPRLEFPGAVRSLQGLSVLVRVAIDSLKWILQNDPERGPALIRMWSVAQSITLRRIALLGAALTDRWNADEKLEWLLQGDYIFLPGFSNEMERVLEVAFAGAAVDERERIICRVVEGPARPMDEVRRDYRIFQLLLKLEGYRSGDSSLVEALTDLRERHPEFVHPTEPPGPDIGAFAQGILPWTNLPFDAKTLSAATPDGAVDMILNYEGEQGTNLDPNEIASVLSQAVLAKPEWSYEFAATIGKRVGYKSYLWNGVIAGWNNSQSDSAHWARVLGFIAEHREIVSVASGEIVQLLERGISQESGGIPDESLTLATAVGREAWTALLPTSASRTEAEEWLTVAINDPAGILMQFELRTLVRLWKQGGDKWKELPPDWRSHLTDIVRGDSWSAAMARVVLASQVHSIFEIDPTFCRAELGALFDWDTNFHRAQQSWHGYLVWGWWSDDFLDFFLPHYVATFPHVRPDLGKFSHEFCEHMAAIAVFSGTNPMTHGWLPQFVRTVDERERITWSHSVGTKLKEAPAEKRQDVWEKWIKTYWEKRIIGVPSQLSGREVAGMTNWLIHLDADFSAAVDLFIQSPLPTAENSYSNTYLYMELDRSSLETRYPAALASLLKRLVESETSISYSEGIENLVRKLIPTHASRKVLIDICERLAVVANPMTAGELKQLVESNGDQDG